MDELDRLILSLDGVLCVKCKGGAIVALETAEHEATAKCQNCGNEWTEHTG